MLWTYELLIHLMVLIELPLNSSFVVRRVMYDRAATFWQMIILVITSLQDMGLFTGRRNRSKILNAQMWGAHMRFFRQMLMASKVI